MSQRRERVLVVVLAGGAGSRLDPLTRLRAKPAVPFGGMYRLIDIALSNVAHSGLDDVWVIEQYEPHALNDHLANGRPWDLDRTHGGLQILPPFQRRDAAEAADAAMATGNADALVRNRSAIAEFEPDVVVTMSADHVYRLDLRDLLDTHFAREARLTAVTTDPPAGDDGRRFAWVKVGEAGTIEDFEYKPDEPSGDRVCTEVFAFDCPVLLDQLEALATGDSAGDYGDTLLPRLVRDGGVVEHVLEGYWRDVGTIDAYHQAHMDLLGDDVSLRLDDPDWPMLTGSVIGGPARVELGADVTGSLLSPGTVVAGTVRDSVLGRGVVVEASATVRRSVILDGAVVRGRACLEDAIVDVDHVVDGRSRPTSAEGTRVRVYTG